MKTETKEIYYCDHCNKLYQRKHAAINHEKVCRNNPDNFRPCFHCNHLSKKEAEAWTGIDDYYSGEPYYETKDLLFCKKKELFLYPPISEIKGNYFEDINDGECNNYPMPKECDKFEDGFNLF